MRPATRALVLAALAAAALGPGSRAEVPVLRDARGRTATVLHAGGSSHTRYDFVIVGDGFTAAEQELFNRQADALVNALLSREPYRSLRCAFNIWRVNTLSEQSRIDDPFAEIDHDTALGCVSRPPGVDFCDSCERHDLIAEAAAHALDADVIVILTHSENPTACAREYVVMPSSSSPEAFGHEMAHRLAGLKDEASCSLLTCREEADRTYRGDEPRDPNVTKESTRESIKWRRLIDPETPVPTTNEALWGDTLVLPGSPPPPDAVGAWEGALMRDFGVYRPQRECYMRQANRGTQFCAVCDAQLRRLLEARCDVCELRPGSAFCTELPLLELIELPALPPPLIRAFIPPYCLTCPTDSPLEDRLRYVGEGLPPGFAARLVGRDGTVLAQAAASANGRLELELAVARGVPLTLELDGRATAAQRALAIKSRLERNGVVQPLP